MVSRQCTHLDQIRPVEPNAAVCEECVRRGDHWVELRMCMTCGNVACCDSSPNRHASAHAESEGHPIVQTHQPGESWRWCYVDRVYL
jgi:hypothetical protein